MSFPDFEFLLYDDFNRAALGGDWTTPLNTGNQSLTISASTILKSGGAGFADGRITTLVMPARLQQSVKVTTLPTGTDGSYMLYRATGSITTLNGYEAGFNLNGVNHDWKVFEITNNSYLQIGTTNSLAVANFTAGDTMGIDVWNDQGQVKTQQYRFNAGAWANIGTPDTDGAPSAAQLLGGSPGVELQNTTMAVDDLKGGGVMTPIYIPTYPSVSMGPF